ncbi:Protein O-mannosyl-transferase 2 [Nymphon striatum]|nr:Protein O-mannosyl-transferase 2 [Nymphon striatum]
MKGKNSTVASSGKSSSNINVVRSRRSLFDYFSQLEKSQDVRWWIVFGVFTFLSLYTRLYKISFPEHVCWDETHFGKMGSWYINRTFFFDVHPPLGKMLIGLSGELTGYDGKFGFIKPGDKYEDTEYVGMRIFCAVLGAALIPFCFNIVWEMTHSLGASSMAATLILLDVGILTLSRYILLDPILLFFISGAVMSMVKFDSSHDKPFKRNWWIWLLLTGNISISVQSDNSDVDYEPMESDNETIDSYESDDVDLSEHEDVEESVKFVGLFVVILIGIKTIFDLWKILGDLSQPMKVVFYHFAARALCLILIPVHIVYELLLYSFEDIEQKSQLEGNSLYQASMPRDVAYGAIITLKNHKTGGGYLHSHWHLYPEGVGARQQQVTAYSHKDENNKFVINRYDRIVKETDDVEFVRNGDLVRIEHHVTTRNLHSHRESAPITKRHQQITCYGENGVGDSNDVWRVEVVGGAEGEIAHTVTSKLRFVHYLTGCALHSHSKQLPKWGYEQMEVSCNPNTRDKNNLWNVEDNIFPRLPNVSFEVYAPSFLERFIESHAVMFQGNAGLKPKEGELTSKPWQWPINYRGQFFSANEYRIYLLGNPFIWWGNIGFMLFFLMVAAIILIKWQRGFPNSEGLKKVEERLCTAGAWLFLGWMIHYVPFYGMGRVLYFHHYFPALLFSSMLTAVVVNQFLEFVHQVLPGSISQTIYHSVTGIFYGIIFYSFYLFYPLSYGMEGPSSPSENSTMHGLRWLESWEF